MRREAIIEALEHAVRDVRIAKLVSALMAGVRFVHENDEETLQRVLTEYKRCKYQGIPIPDGKGIFGVSTVAAVKRARQLLVDWMKDEKDWSGVEAVCEAEEFLGSALKNVDAQNQSVHEFIDRADDLLDESGTKDDLEGVFKCVLEARGHLARALALTS